MAWLAVASGLAAQALLLLWLRFHGGGQLSSILRGHDGAEYLDYAWHLAAFQPGEVPIDCRRHEAGWPIILALFSWIFSVEMVARPLIWGAFAGAILAFSKLLQEATRLDIPQIGTICLGLAISYPANLYYQCFAMAESAFLFFIIAGMLLYTRNKRIAAYLVAGFAATIRGPGVFLIFAFVATDLIRRERPAKLLAVLAGIAPIVAVGWFVASFVGDTPISVHRPVFGLPFGGFRGAYNLGAARVAYVLTCVILIGTGIFLVCLEASRSKWKDPFVSVAAVYAGSFLLFHLCLKSLRYHGSTVYTFNYQDRYLVGVLPVALYGLRRFLKPWVIVASGVTSLALSAYWGHHYFQALRTP